MNDLISVIIPVYNAENYLDACVSGVLAQAYGELEILLIDDGSTDGSGATCDAFQARDPRVRVIHKKNGGASAARNAGLRAATGNYVFFLDSDDSIVPEAMEKLLANAKQNESDIVFFDAYTMEEETGRRSDENYYHKERYMPGSGKDLMARMTKNGDFHMGICLQKKKKSLLDANGLYFKEGIVYEDFLFTCQAYCLANRVSYVPEHLYYRLYHTNSVMTAKKTIKNFVSAETVYTAVRDFSEQNGNVVPSVYLARGAYNVLTCYEALSAKEKQDAAPHLRTIKKDILAHGGYGDPALRMRCYGKPLWAAARAVQKIIGQERN